MPACRGPASVFSQAFSVETQTPSSGASCFSSRLSSLAATGRRSQRTAIARSPMKASSTRSSPPLIKLIRRRRQQTSVAEERRSGTPHSHCQGADRSRRTAARTLAHAGPTSNKHHSSGTPPMAPTESTNETAGSYAISRFFVASQVSEQGYPANPSTSRRPGKPTGTPPHQQLGVCRLTACPPPSNRVAHSSMPMAATGPSLPVGQAGPVCLSLPRGACRQHTHGSGHLHTWRGCRIPPS